MYKSEVQGKGGIYAKVVEDSISESGTRLTTLELKYPRFIHSEFMTHRMFSRSASSSRAIPFHKLVSGVKSSPAMPIFWGENKSGMQADTELESGEDLWKKYAFDAANNANEFNEVGYHKQIVNRLIEPFSFIKVVVTSTEFENFFRLRIHKDAQPEIKELGLCVFSAMNLSVPKLLDSGQYHLPYVDINEFGEYTTSVAIKCSVSRCARVSYLNHDNSKPDVTKDLELYDMLCTRPYRLANGKSLSESDPKHLSPLEHQAYPMEKYRLDVNESGSSISSIEGTHVDKNGDIWSGNFRHWVQYRQTVDD